MKNIKRYIIVFAVLGALNVGAWAQGTPTVTMNTDKTTVSFQMPDIGVKVNYTMLRNIGKRTEFVGIPTEPVIVKKGAGDKYETETPLTYQLNDLLLEGAAQNITQADGIAIHMEKVGDGDTWSEVENIITANNYVPGTYRLVATGTGLYKGTLTSDAFTVIDEYELDSIYTLSMTDGKVERVTYYDLQGRPVTKPAKGVFIMNGKKVVIK